MFVESHGGIAPPTKRIIFNFAKEVGSPSAVDRTDYGTASGSARGFAQHHHSQKKKENAREGWHHSQQLSRAAVYFLLNSAREFCCKILLNTNAVNEVVVFLSPYL